MPGIFAAPELGPSGWSWEAPAWTLWVASGRLCGGGGGRVCLLISSQKPDPRSGIHVSTTLALVLL